MKAAELPPLPAGFKLVEPGSAPTEFSSAGSPPTDGDNIPPPPPGFVVQDIGRPRAFAAGAKAGATLNFGDELAGAYVAGAETDPILTGLLNRLPGPLRSAVQTFLSHNPLTAAPHIGMGIGRIAVEHVTGQKGEATKAYEGARDASRAELKAAKEQYPGTTIAGEVAGSLAVPIPGSLAARAPTIPGRMLRGAGAGATIGGASGLGEGEDIPDRLTKGAAGTAAGFVLGGLAPPLIEGTIHGARAVTQPVASAIRGAISPEAEAGRRVVTAIERDARADPQAVSRLTPAEFAQARAAGEPVTVMDLGGGLTRRLADSAAITSPEGGTSLNRAIDSRFEGQADRFTNWLRGAFHYPDAYAQQQAIEAAGRAANRPAYVRAEREAARTHPGGLWDEGFEQISQAPVVQDAIRKASITGGNRAAREGFTPVGNPFVLDPASGRMVLRTNPDGSRAVPNLRFWDEVKKNLDKVNTRDSQDFARVLREHVDELVPAYREARAGAAHFFHAEHALEAGQNFVGASQRFGLRAASDALSRMTPAERRLFQDGYVSRFIERLESTADRRSVLNQIAQSPAARRELAIALGPQRAAELEVRLRVEGIMDLARGAVQGNSWTARRLYDLGLAGGAGIGSVGLTQTDPTQITIGAVVAALSSGGKRINENVARRVAEMLTSQDPRVLARGIQAVTRNNRLMDALRATDIRIARAGGHQAPGAAPMQAAGTGHAEEDKPSVPRPGNR